MSTYRAGQFFFDHHRVIRLLYCLIHSIECQEYMCFLLFKNSRERLAWCYQFADRWLIIDSKSLAWSSLFLLIRRVLLVYPNVITFCLSTAHGMLTGCSRCKSSTFREPCLFSALFFPVRHFPFFPLVFIHLFVATHCFPFFFGFQIGISLQHM